MTVYISAKAICTPRRRACNAAYSLTLSRVALSCATMRVEDQGDLRFRLVDARKRLLGGLQYRLIELGVGALDGRDFGGEYFRHRQSADLRLRGEELAEAGAILVEQRLGPRHVEGHGEDVATDQLAVLAHIGFRDDH
jgi:hypothetical protein